MQGIVERMFYLEIDEAEIKSFIRKYKKEHPDWQSYYNSSKKNKSNENKNSDTYENNQESDTKTENTFITLSKYLLTKSKPFAVS